MDTGVPSGSKGPEEVLIKPSLLYKPKEGEILLVYLTVSEVAISAVLVQEDEANFIVLQASVLHHERFLRYRLDISQLEFELKEQVRQKDMYRSLSEQQNEDLKDLLILQAELEKAQKEASTLKWEHADLVEKVKVFEAKNEQLVMETNNTTLQVQQKIDLIDRLLAEMDEKEVEKAKLASVENQLRVVKDKVDKWSQLNDDLRAQLSSAITERDSLGREYAALRSKLDMTSTDAEEIMSQYKDDLEAAETHLRTKTEYIKRLSRRETLEEIHARGFDLSTEIEEARRLEEKELYEPECPEGSGGSEASDGSGGESGPDEDKV
ncbi:uncharacterized protein [Nicotiana tomentosiformis]|uniref:uncharacterized protein n=1 Tax=Nicotiana tomentosiformis TaxID=4098 RepID=UPI00388CC1DD